MEKAERRCLTSREERILLQKLGGVGTVFEIIEGTAAVTVHRGDGSHFWRRIVSRDDMIDLVWVTCAGLGLPKGGATEEVVAAARAVGLRPCPEEIMDMVRVPWGYETMNLALVPKYNSGAHHPGYVGVDVCGRVVAEVVARHGVDHVWGPEQKWIFYRP